MANHGLVLPVIIGNDPVQALLLQAQTKSGDRVWSAIPVVPSYGEDILVLDKAAEISTQYLGVQRSRHDILWLGKIEVMPDETLSRELFVCLLNDRPRHLPHLEGRDRNLWLCNLDEVNLFTQDPLTLAIQQRVVAYLKKASEDVQRAFTFVETLSKRPS